MRAVYLLPFIPASALAAAVTSRWPKWKYIPCLLFWPCAGTLLVLVFRGWERHVGPGPFRWAGCGLSSSNLFFLVLLVLAGPASILLLPGKREEKASPCALGLLALAGALAAVLADHPFLLAAGCVLGTGCAAVAAGQAAQRGRGGMRVWAAFLPLPLSDACLALSLLFISRAGIPEGLSTSSLPAVGGGLSALVLLLVAALLRLGTFPLNAGVASLSAHGRRLRAPYLVLINPTLGAYLLFLAWRVLFSPGGEWEWVLLGAGAAGLVSAVPALLRGPLPGKRKGWVAACLGSGIILCFSAGGREGATAARLVLLSGVPALLLLEFAEDKGWRRVLGIAGAAALVGAPPLAGFGSLWMAGGSLAGAREGVAEAMFFLGWVTMAAAFAVAGMASLAGEGEEGEGAPSWVAASCGPVLCATLFLAGAYPGRVVDVLLREYGLPLEAPFNGWSSLAWASLAVVAGWSFLRGAWARVRSPGAGKISLESMEYAEGGAPTQALPVLPGGRERRTGRASGGRSHHPRG